MTDDRVIQELNMDRKRILECIEMIEKQIKKGYIDLGLFDVAEVEIIDLAIKEFKVNHGLNDI